MLHTKIKEVEDLPAMGTGITYKSNTTNTPLIGRLMAENGHNEYTGFCSENSDKSPSQKLCQRTVLIDDNDPGALGEMADMHILIVDDEPETTEELTELLEDLGFSVNTSTDPIEAIQIVKKNPAISIVITDQSMPTMTGLEMIEEINSIFLPERDLAVIVVTGQSNTNWAIKALRLGALDFLSKPINPDVLIHATHRAVETIRLKRLERDFRKQLERRVVERTEEVQKLSNVLQASKELLQIKNSELKAANQIKSEFLALISHEFLTPLNTIIGFSSLMESENEVSGSIQGVKNSRYILDAGNKLLIIINTILELINVSSGNLQLNKKELNPIDLINRVVDVLKPKAEKAGVEMILGLTNMPKLVRADSLLLSQTIRNILNNAIQFSARSGTVVIAASAINEIFKVTITDQGIGMTNDQIKTAKKAFRQVDGSPSKTAYGLGLGLTMSKLIAELHGGSLSVESSLGEGTSITILIPFMGKFT